MAEANLLVPLPDDMARLMKLTKWQAAEIQRLRERVFELETDPHGGDVIPLAQPRDGELRRHCRTAAIWARRTAASLGVMRAP